MHHDVTRITLHPAMAGKALPLLGAWLQAQSKGRLFACWTSETGALNEVMLLRGYEDEAVLAAERDAAARSDNPYGIAEFTAAIDSGTWVPFPFVTPIPSGELGPFFEVRTYRLKMDGLASTLERWKKALPARLGRSPLVTAMYSLTGAPRFMHVWPYKSLDARGEIRAKAVVDGIWPPPGGAGCLIEMKNEIFVPAAFSPLR
jgi:hypothetical protein